MLQRKSKANAMLSATCLLAICILLEFYWIVCKACIKADIYMYGHDVQRSLIIALVRRHCHLLSTSITSVCVP